MLIYQDHHTICIHSPHEMESPYQRRHAIRIYSPHEIENPSALMNWHNIDALKNINEWMSSEFKILRIVNVALGQITIPCFLFTCGLLYIY